MSKGKEGRAMDDTQEQSTALEVGGRDPNS